MSDRRGPRMQMACVPCGRPWPYEDEGGKCHHKWWCYAFFSLWAPVWILGPPLVFLFWCLSGGGIR